MANTTDDDLASGDDTDDTGGTGPDRGVDTDGGSDGGVLSIIRSGNLRAFLLLFMGAASVDLLVGEEGLLTNPKEFIIGVVRDWLFNTVLRPIAESIWNGGVAIIDALAIAFFGGDYAIGHPGTTTVGVLDVPFLVTGPIGGSYLSVGDAISAAITGVNIPIIETMSQLGIAAPIVAPVLVVGELAAAAWLLWVIVSVVDVPGVRIMATVRAALKPMENFVRWLLS